MQPIRRALIAGDDIFDGTDHPWRFIYLGSATGTAIVMPLLSILTSPMSSSAQTPTVFDGDQLLVNTYGFDSQREGALALGENGSTLITWSTDSADNGDNLTELKDQRFFTFVDDEERAQCQRTDDNQSD